MSISNNNLNTHTDVCAQTIKGSEIPPDFFSSPDSGTKTQHDDASNLIQDNHE